MNEFLDKASSHLTGKENISDINIEELERLVQEHPYFSVSQVLLAKKYKFENHSAFLPQVQKAALHFNNPYWLHYQLLDKNTEIVFNKPADLNVQETSVIGSTETTDFNSAYQFKPVEEDKQEESIYTKDEIIAASSLAKETLSDDETSTNLESDNVEIQPDEMHPEKEEILEEIEENINIENVETPDKNESEKAIVSPTEDSSIGNESSEADVIFEQPSIEKVNNTHPESEPETSLLTDNSQEIILPVEEEKQAEDILAEKDLIETVVENTLVQPVSIDESLEKTLDIQTAATNEDVIEQPEEYNEVKEDIPVNENPHDGSAESNADPIPSDLEQPTTTPPPVEGEPLIPIEPYYTVDYFASQGIKLVLDKNPQDKLGKQLRSFTDWLKHMKKLGPEDAIKSTQATEVDPVIKNIADTSNKPEEIITEAMAEVLIKQGKNEQAIEVYNKLSFLNPDKSTYFADQIQKLKGT